MNTDNATTADTKPREAPPRGQPRLLDVLDAVEKLSADLTTKLAELQAENVALREQVEDLTHIVQAALPAALVQLPHETVEQLHREAPTTELRLLAPFISPGSIDLKIGYQLQAGDFRVRQYGRSMSLGLALTRDDAPLREANRIMVRQATKLAEQAKTNRQANAASEAERLHREAERLQAEATGT